VSKLRLLVVTCLFIRPVGHVVAVIAVLSMAGCGASAGPSPQSPASARSADVPSQPRTVLAGRVTSGAFRTIKPGTPVDSKQLTTRVFADARRGFALFENLAGETFPATTTDGGRVWRVAGPVLHAPAAQGALAVTQVGTAGPGRYMAFGDGSVVDVTSDGGKQWWRAALGDEVPAVIASGGQLIAFAQEQAPTARETLHAVVWVYRSTDGGRVWHATKQLAPP
jgi:photosystem II stability/assembly factor-like uncharacterized protein